MAINAGAGGGAEAGSGESTARAFVRRSSGLVRDVSPMQALFFSMAAVLGGGIAFTFQNMTVTFQPMWQAGFTAYAWSAIAVGGACVLLASPLREPEQRDAEGGRELRLYVADPLAAARLAGVLVVR